MTKLDTANPDELLDFLSDRAEVDRQMKDGTFQDSIKEYVLAVKEKDREQAEQVKEQVQAALADMLRNDPELAKLGNNVRPNLTPPTGPNNRYRPTRNDRAVGAPLNGVFTDLGDFFACVYHGANLSAEQAGKLQKVRDYQEKIPSEGGFLVPEEFRADLLALSLESAIVRPRATVIPMGSQTLRIPSVDDTSHATTVFGGVQVYRTEEGAELVESAASFASVKLDASKQTALAHVTNELIRDAAGGFGLYIERTFPAAISWFEDLDFISANGAGVPLGALNTNNPALIAVAGESGQTVDTIVWENVIRMYSRMLPQSLNNAVWLAAPDTFVELATMALSVGTGGSAIWLTNGQDAPVLTLLGRPVIMTEKAPGAVGAQGDLSLVDWGMYLIGDRQTMTLESSPHVKFTSDKTTYRAIQRNDGRPWVMAPITPHTGGSTLSPYVTLADR